MKVDLEKLKENLEAGVVTYDNFVTMCNNKKDLTISEFFELMNDDISERIICDDFIVIVDYISLISDNIEKEFKCDMFSEWMCDPKENGGIYQNSLILNNPALGLLGNYINITAVCEISIDFRSQCSAYVRLLAYNDESKLNFLGENQYIHFDVNFDGVLSAGNLEGF